jgi:hypothetical protein
MNDRNDARNISLWRVLIKALLLFFAVDLIFVPLNPLSMLGQVSAYNSLIPGRLRLPYGENPDQAYNLSLYSLDAMFASHELSAGKKPPGEYRVLLIGDSSVWGYLLKPDQTLSAYINAADLTSADGRQVHAYNLGYPTLSLTKDLVILRYAMQYQPDLIIWLLTLESFPVNKQLDSPILQNNPAATQDLISTYSLKLDLYDPRFVTSNFWDATLIGERRALADVLRLQLYGIMWAATGIDQYYPATYEPPQADLAQDKSFQNLLPPTLYPQDLSLDVLSAGVAIAGNVRVVFVNEPIYLSHGKNSDIRYNFFYPRWAYDQYRQFFLQTCQAQNWKCLDEWDLVASNEFTNSAIHMSPLGTHLLADELGKVITTSISP